MRIGSIQARWERVSGRSADPALRNTRIYLTQSDQTEASGAICAQTPIAFNAAYNTISTANCLDYGE
jgi:hypothetical protein